MIKVLPRNLLRFLVLVLFQGLILNNVQVSNLFIPNVYILFIILMPFETPKWVLLVSAFFLGLSVDSFTFTFGLHASATVFMAFVRPYVLAALSPRDGFEPGSFPRIYYYGFNWFLKYTLILVFVHHFALFFLEIFRFTDFFFTFSRVVLSTLFSVFLIVLSQYFVFRK